MLRPWVVPLLTLLLAAGCSSHRGASRFIGIPPDWPAAPAGAPSNAVTEIVTLEPELTPRFPTTNPPLPIKSGPLPLKIGTATSSPLTHAVTESWISFERWCREHQLPAPHRQKGGTATSYLCDTPAGRLRITPENRSAGWDGMELRLGFAPRWIDGKAFIHGLDAQKNLLPLLALAPALKTNAVIVVDPGHGGQNVGAQSVLGEHYEKTYTLDWAKRLAARLESDGWRVVLTRTNDADVSLADRVALAEREHADLFLSLHFNSAAPKETEAGLETYCLTPVGLPSTISRGYEDDSSVAHPNNAFDAANLQFAVGLHRALLRVQGLSDRGIRRARFTGILRGQNRPAVLLEGGYLSNRKEARRIADPQYRQQLAEAVARALVLKTDAGATNLTAGTPASANGN